MTTLVEHLNQGLGLESALEFTQERLRRWLGCSWFGLRVLDESQSQIVRIAAFVDGVRVEEVPPRIPYVDGRPIPPFAPSAVLAERRAGTGPGAAAIDLELRAYSAEGMQSLLCVGLLANGRPTGSLDLAWREPQSPPPGAALCLRRVGGLLSILAERGRFLHRADANDQELAAASALKSSFTERLKLEIERQTTELRRTQQTQRILLEIAKAIHRTLDLALVFRTLVQTLRPVMSFERASILMISEDHQSLRFRELEPAEREFLGRESVIPMEGSAAGAAIREGRPIVTGDLGAGTIYYEDSFLRRAGIRSRVCIPLYVQGRPIGTLNLASNAANRFASDEVDFLVQLADQISVAVANSEAYREIEKLKNRLQAENVQLREVLTRSPHLSELVGVSAGWKRVLKQVDMVARTQATVLIRGETGTGKELVARTVHRLSERAARPFVAINCATLTPELIASELFGHEKGAFTGALQRKLGRLELADGGTLFLDEVAELPGDMQVKLLRVLQEREFERVGGTSTIRVDVRFIAATNRALEDERARGRFRDDLFYRLNVFPILVPPLRDRPEDIEPLLTFFLSRYAQKVNRSFSHIDRTTIERCLQYGWPGNVRELENLVERSVILSPGPTFVMDLLLEGPAAPAPSPPPITLRDNVREHMIRVLKSTRGKIYGSGGAAEALGLKPPTLQAKLKKLGINRADFTRG